MPSQRGEAHQTFEGGFSGATPDGPTVFLQHLRKVLDRPASSRMIGFAALYHRLCLPLSVSHDRQGCLLAHQRHLLCDRLRIHGHVVQVDAPPRARTAGSRRSRRSRAEPRKAEREQFIFFSTFWYFFYFLLFFWHLFLIFCLIFKLFLYILTHFGTF